jgi:hypothetical protein
LFEYIRTTYASTTSRLASHFKNREITYDLLWALFTPKTPLYTTILDAEKPACYTYDSGSERKKNGVTYFHVGCHYLDFNGQVFGEVSTALGISTFPGAKRIDRLEAFPLKFHRRHKEMREYFVRCGRQFVSLMGQHHVQYHGNAFYIQKGGYVEVPVDSRIMVDVAYFREVNPNYTRPQINELARQDLSSSYILFSDADSDEVKSSGLDTKTMSEGELMVCSQTVYGWSFGNKKWRKSSSLQRSGKGTFELISCKVEFVVDDIQKIVWNPSSFDNLAIPAAKKKIIIALAKAHISRTSDDMFDDFVDGKGQGLIALLQYEVWRFALTMN